MSAADVDLDGLRRALDGDLALPGSPDYEQATSPRNATAHQVPMAVALVRGDDDVAACVRWAVDAGVRVVVQATGHGAGRPVAATDLMVHTRHLDHVEVDPQRRVVRVGAGATSGAVGAAAWRHGLLHPGGTAPDVGIAGYTFHGGIGWLTRPHGTAASGLGAVRFVDGSGAVRRAGEDAARPEDREALWAFRGGGGVGVATELELPLFPATDLWAGYLLWPAQQAEEVIGAWGEALEHLDPALSTSISLLHAPDAPTVPEPLRGRRVVHLCAASTAGPEAGRHLRAVLGHLPPPAIDTLGPCDVERLVGIHLDPPVATPAVGEGRWLTAAAGARAAAILSAAGLEDDAPAAEAELRWVAVPPSGVAGALTDPPGPVLLHVTGAAPSPEAYDGLQRRLDAVVAAAADVDTGHGAAAYRDGRESAMDALAPDAQRRLAAIHHAVDPQVVFKVSRPLADLDDLVPGSTGGG